MRVDFDLIDDQIFNNLVEFVIQNLTSPILTEENFSTTEEDISGDGIFPFIYLHRILGTETALDLERDTLNGALLTYEIRVTSNDSHSQANDIMNSITKAMKSMKFNSTSLPLPSDSNNLHKITARWQRTFNSGDLI